MKINRKYITLTTIFYSFTVNADTIYQQAFDYSNSYYISTVDTRALDLYKNDPNYSADDQSYPFYIWGQLWNAFSLNPAKIISNTVHSISWTGLHDSSLNLTDVDARFYIEISDAEVSSAPLLISEDGVATESRINNSNFYNYTMALSSAISLEIGHTYYLSIQAEYQLPNYSNESEFTNAIWYWGTSGTGNSLIYSNVTNPAISNTLNKDFAFSLNGDVKFTPSPNPVPVPSTLLLFGSAIIGMSSMWKIKSAASS